MVPVLTWPHFFSGAAEAWWGSPSQTDGPRRGVLGGQALSRDQTVSQRAWVPALLLTFLWVTQQVISTQSLGFPIYKRKGLLKATLQVWCSRLPCSLIKLQGPSGEPDDPACPCLPRPALG